MLNEPPSVEDKQGSVVPCVQCRTPISVDAGLCVHCGSYQSAVKNWLRYLYSVGALALAAALFAYGAPELWRWVFWRDDVRVLQFYSYGELAVANAGYGSIFVSYLGIEAEQMIEGRLWVNHWDVNMEVPRDGIGVKSYINPEVSKTLQLYGFVVNVSDEVWSRALRSSEWAEVALEKDSCFVSVILSKSDPLYLGAQRAYGSGLRTVPLKATLHYYSVGTRRMQRLDVPVIGVLARKRAPHCDELIR